MATYIEVNLTLDSFDLIQIETLINHRIDELKAFKEAQKDIWFHVNLAEEQLYNYRVTLKKIKAARAEVKRIAEESRANHPAFKPTQTRRRKPKAA